MDQRQNIFAPQSWKVGLILFFTAASGPAEMIRVTTWNWQPGPDGTSREYQQSAVLEAAAALKKLHPDVILLQQVADWETCQRLVQAMQPEDYEVAICSAFRDPRTRLPARQVAILAKAKAYLAWSEAWQNSGETPGAAGGFAFAALRLGEKNMGIFSLQQTRSETAGQFLQQIETLQSWKVNRPQGYIVAGDFNGNPDGFGLEKFGFENAFAKLPSGQAAPATVDYIFTRETGLVFPPLLTRATHFGHDAATCEMDLASPGAAPATAPAKTTPAGAPRTLSWLAAIVAGGLVLFVLALRFVRRPLPHPVHARLPDSKGRSFARLGSAQTGQSVVTQQPGKPPFVQVEMEASTQTQSQTWQPRPTDGGATNQTSEGVRAGVIANLTRWLKEKVVQRLISDRAQLLATQEAAALKMQAVDVRLSKVEQQIQQRNKEYERRIDDLLKALITAEEENRVLIRAQITFLRSEIEKSRLKAEQRGDEYEKF